MAQTQDRQVWDFILWQTSRSSNLEFSHALCFRQTSLFWSGRTQTLVWKRWGCLSSGTTSHQAWLSCLQHSSGLQLLGVYTGNRTGSTWSSKPRQHWSLSTAFYFSHKARIISLHQLEYNIAQEWAHHNSDALKNRELRAGATLYMENQRSSDLSWKRYFCSQEN